MAKSTQEKIVSVRAFARQIGVTDGAVRKAVSSWKFTVGVQEDGKINAVAAMDDPWVKKQLVVHAKAGVSRGRAIEKLESKKELMSTDLPPDEDITSDETGQVADEDIANTIKVNKSLKAAEAMRRREIVALALDKKKLQEQEGILVRRDAVEKALYLLGSELKKALLDIPARVVRDIMAAETEVEGIKILTDELYHVLNTYGNMNSKTF